MALTVCVCVLASFACSSDYHHATQGDPIARHLEKEAKALIETATKHRLDTLTFEDRLLRELSTEQLAELVRFHWGMRVNCQYLLHDSLLAFLKRNAQDKDNAVLRVHCKLCLHLNSADARKSLLDDIVPRVHKEYTLREQVLQVADDFIARHELKVDKTHMRL